MDSHTRRRTPDLSRLALLCACCVVSLVLSAAGCADSPVAPSSDASFDGGVMSGLDAASDGNAASDSGTASQARPCIALTPDPGATSIDSAWATARAAGFREPGDVNVGWADLEPSPRIYADFDGVFASARATFEDADAISLTLAVIQTTTRSVPSDLTARGWDDAEMIERIVAAAEYMLGETRALPVHAIAIGNEVDGVVQSPAEIAAYARMLAAVRARLHVSFPGVDVGAKLTFTALVDPRYDAIFASSDLANVTLYPLGSDFSVRSVDALRDDLAQLAAAHPELPLFLSEFGVPTSATLGSSDAHQREAVEAVWSWAVRTPRVRSVCFTWQNDLSTETLDVLIALYGVADPAFREFLGTLGLRRAGSDKPAFTWLRGALADGIKVAVPRPQGPAHTTPPGLRGRN